jgi:hypothetical protein
MFLRIDWLQVDRSLQNLRCACLGRWPGVATALLAVTGVAITSCLVSCAHDPYAKSAGFSGLGNYQHFQPSLVQIARMHANGGKDDPYNTTYTITDRDVLDYTDHIEALLSQKMTNNATARYGSSTGQLVLSSLTALVKTLSWTTAAASGLGVGNSFLFGLGQNIDAKGRAQAYETALTSVKKAESTYYFGQTGMKFKTENGKTSVDSSGAPAMGKSGIPSSATLTADGETLYYRVTKTLRVLEDALANKIPNLQDLKDSQGDNSQTTTAASPVKQ